MLRDVRCQACEERREQARGHARQRAQHRGALSLSRNLPWLRDLTLGLDDLEAELGGSLLEERDLRFGAIGVSP